MGAGGERLQAVLERYDRFLIEKDLSGQTGAALPHPVGSGVFPLCPGAWGVTFEQTLERFLAEVGGRAGTKPWQLQQASDAIRIYRYQYRGAKTGHGDSPTTQAFVDDAARLERLREVIRMRHDAGNTEVK